MISSIIEQSLKSVSTDTITDIYTYIIAGLFIFALLWIRKDSNHKFINYVPSLLTSVGILGTFTGIVIGLFDFNPNDIDKSIPLLLEGLKTAFITSIVGIAASILFKFIYSTNILSKKETEIQEDIGVEDMYAIMREQNESLIAIQKSFNDNSESSMIGQVKLLRSDILDNNKRVNETLSLMNENFSKLLENSNEQKETFIKFQDTLWIKLQDFADMLSKSATEQVIEALNGVIKDFNEKLTEQFGENFKELNTAVHKLVDWQENYKVQLGEMKSQFDLSVNTMGQMEKSVESISTNTESIPKSMGELETIITTNQHQVEELNRHLEAFKEIKDKAVEAVPEIRNQIDTTIKGIQEASIELIDGVASGAEKMSSAIVQSADEFAHNVSATNGALVESSNTLTKNSIDIKEQLEAALLDINKHIRQMINDMISNNKEISSEFKDTGKVLLEEFTHNNSNIQKGLKELSSNLQNNMDELANEQMKHVQKVVDSLSHTIEQTLNRTGESVQNQVEMIDKVAEKEIENVMNAMGTALARISNQFTGDYQKLVAEMKQIVNSHR